MSLDVVEEQTRRIIEISTLKRIYLEKRERNVIHRIGLRKEKEKIKTLASPPYCAYMCGTQKEKKEK